MSRKLLIPFLAAAFLAAPALAPAPIADVFSGSAQAVKNLNTSRSNVYRQKDPKSDTPATKKLAPPPKPAPQK